MLDALCIGYAIKDRRTELGMTQAQVADAAGVSKRFLWSLELGQNPGAQFDKLTAVLNVLGIELEIKNQERCAVKAPKENIAPKAAPATGSNPHVADALAILTGNHQ